MRFWISSACILCAQEFLCDAHFLNFFSFCVVASWVLNLQLTSDASLTFFSLCMAHLNSFSLFVMRAWITSACMSSALEFLQKCHALLTLTAHVLVNSSASIYFTFELFYSSLRDIFGFWYIPLICYALKSFNLHGYTLDFVQLACFHS